MDHYTRPHRLCCCPLQKWPTLLLTSLLTPGLSIDGIGTWVIATLIIWVLSVFIWVIPGPWRTVKRERDRKDST